MRVTEQMVFRQSITDISRQRQDLFNLQAQGASGKQFQKLEDDPIAAERLRLLKESSEATLHFEKNIKQGSTQLEAADGALGAATDLVIRAKELGLTAATDTLSANERTIVANEIGSIFNSMVVVANTKAGGEFVFGGFLTDTPPFQANGTFVGNNGQKQVDVGPSSRLTVNVSGESAFTITGGLDVFAELNTLQTALNINDTAQIRTSLDRLDQVIDQVARARTDAGLKLNQLDVAESVRSRIEDSIKGEESSLIDIDSVKVFMDLNETSKALQDAVSVSQEVTKLSFLSVG